MAESIEASVHVMKVEQAYAAAQDPAAAPAWFNPSMTAALVPLKQSGAKHYNVTCGSGQNYPFEEVPFNNGSMPTDLLNNLPLLSNSTVLSRISVAQANAYIHGYGLAPGGSVREKRERIAIFIGCRDNLLM